ncbi:hypothetical protein PCK1_002893 [Pneumocystis canis]|nr:hypothetical protein PCK1_002893 [Pneumocystis canis]
MVLIRGRLRLRVVLEQEDSLDFDRKNSFLIKYLTNYELWTTNTYLGDLSPTYTIKHNNQTGRWVTILRAQWHENPSTGVQKFTIGNMQRYIDIYSSKGVHLSSLGDSKKITFVPAVCQFHPTEDWLVGGSASGKVVAYLPPEK